MSEYGNLVPSESSSTKTQTLVSVVSFGIDDIFSFITLHLPPGAFATPAEAFSTIASTCLLEALFLSWAAFNFAFLDGMGFLLAWVFFLFDSLRKDARPTPRFDG